MGVNKAMQQSKSKGTAANGGGNAKFGKGFVNCNISDADKAAVKKYAQDADKILEALHSLIIQGYKYSVSESEKTSSFVASLTDRREGSPSHMYTLSAHAPDPLLAMASVLYKHYALLAETWPISGETGDGWF